MFCADLTPPTPHPPPPPPTTPPHMTHDRASTIIDQSAMHARETPRCEWGDTSILISLDSFAIC